MTKLELISLASKFVESSKGNRISREIAISDDVVGMKIFEDPVFAFGNAEDDYFETLKNPAAIGEHFLTPVEWLPAARTVISFFLPFTDIVKKSNVIDSIWPSNGWLHGRIEGQECIDKLCAYLVSKLTAAGYKSVAPFLDRRFWSRTSPGDGPADPGFTSNWSERHVAFVCGLGTFGLSKGLITAKGMAGRLGSIITELYVPSDTRGYTDIYEYCTKCGACVRRCPAGAITPDKGKDHALCSAFLNETAEKYRPRYGCGKCQTQVPCESRIPPRV